VGSSYLFALVDVLLLVLGFVLPDGRSLELVSAVGMRLTFWGLHFGVCWETADCGNFACVVRLMLNVVYIFVTWAMHAEVALRGTGGLRGLLNVGMTERIGTVINFTLKIWLPFFTLQFLVASACDYLYPDPTFIHPLSYKIAHCKGARASLRW
jgi:hypothetical protein